MGRPKISEGLEFDIEQFKKLVAESNSICILYSKTNIGSDRLRRLIDKYRIDTSHFVKHGKGVKRVDNMLDMICPVCSNPYTTQKRAPSTTCGYSCANKFFRAGVNKRNRKSTGRNGTVYRHRCFKQYGKKCIICDESIAVDVHHIDGNYHNNATDNLIPLCANHHRYAHIKKQKPFIEKKIKEFLAKHNSCRDRLS
jgi:hypothetical protein